MCMRMTVAALAALLCSSTSQAQVQQPQFVQLPTFTFFTVSTTVSVPVSGRGVVGRVYRRGSASVTRSLPWMSRLPAASRLARTRAISTETTSSVGSVGATLLDLAELDDATLAAAKVARRGLARHAGDASEAKALRLSGHVAPAAAPQDRPRDQPLGGPVKSVAEIRRLNAIEDARREQALLRYWEQARAAERAGRLGAARCNYQLLARRAEGRLRRAAQVRLAALNESAEVARSEDPP